MSCVIWTEPDIEAACRRYLAAWLDLREATTCGLGEGVIRQRRDALADLDAVTREALASTPDRAVRVRGEGWTLLLCPMGVYVTESVIRVEPTDAMRLGGRSGAKEWQVY